MVQRFTLPNRGTKVVLLGAVGPLQFEIVQHRLKQEYGADSRLEPAPWTFVRWPGTADADAADLRLPTGVAEALDPDGERVLLFEDEWQLRMFAERNPGMRLSQAPSSTAADGIGQSFSSEPTARVAGAPERQR